MPILLNLLYLLGLLILSPFILYRILITRKPIQGFTVKLFGLVPEIPSHHATIWFHGVSVGEVHLLRQVVAMFRERHPNYQCVISTTTATGMEEAQKAFNDLPVFFFPFDFTWAIKRAMRRINPRLIVLAESELWPNFLLTAKRLAYPIAVINGRMSPRSMRRYHRLRWLTRPLWRCISLFAVQAEEHAQNLATLGVEQDKLIVTGSVKYDGVLSIDTTKVREMRTLLAIRDEELLWIAGSTQAPEEEIALRIYRELKPSHPQLRLILVPRHRERFDEVARILARENASFVRRSTLTEPLTSGTDMIVLVDTFGEQSALWALADIAYVGGSLDGKRGGQNMIEPAGHGAAVTFGPHVWNFRDTVKRLLEAKAAIQVQNETELLTTVRGLLDNPVKRQEQGERARRLVEAQQGATEATINALGRLLTLIDNNEKAHESSGSKLRRSA